ncbi:MAG: glycosyltransferase family 4 protein [Chloroflexota bacterium]|nr:glycosyltransferase family 4 protein [Chloroflexota bacterium]
MTGLSIGVNAHLLSFVPGYRRAGVSQYTEQIVRHFMGSLPQANDALTIFAGPTAPPDGYVPNGVRWVSSRLPTGHAPGRILWEQVVAPIATTRAHLDVLFCPVNVVPLASPVPSVVTVHDLAFLAYPEAFPAAKRRYLTAMTRLSVRRARHLIAVSAHTRDDLVQHFGVRPERVTVIPNAADERYRPAATRDDITRFKAAHTLPDRFILFVGTLEPRKNLRRLIEGFALLRDDDPDVKLVIVGASGWLTSDLAPLVQSRGLSDRTIFTGYVSDDDLPRWYQAATVFCYPSLYEGFGLPVLEAMACATPVVTSRTSSLPEVAGDAALLVDPTDVRGLANALQSVLADGARRQAMSEAGIARSHAYSWERTAAATLAVIRDAARH